MGKMKSLWIVLAGLSIAPSIRAGDVERPNIVQIMADDLGWGAVGYNGQEFVKTPFIDTLAENGMVFHRAYAAPVCSPTRASLQVGYHTGHTWTDRNIRWHAKGFRKASKTIGKVLKEAGYVTGAFGKWGFGGSKGEGKVLHQNPVIDNPTTLPTNQGYDEFYGCLDHVRAHTYFMSSLWEDSPKGPSGLTLTPTGNTVDAKFNRYCHDLYAQHSERFLRKHASQSRPFYLQIHYQIPHAPLAQIEKVAGWFEQYSDVDTAGWSDKAKQYAAMVTRMDRSIGRILALLRDPNEDGETGDSVLEKTLILFTSDNGGYRGAGFTDRFEVNGSLRGGKGSLFEGGIRVPMVAYWPAKIEAGSDSRRPVDITDVLPTLADVAEHPAPVGIDGVSFAPTLLGKGHQRQRKYLAFEDHQDWAIVGDSMKLIRWSENGGHYALYNLKADPGERHNLLSDKESSVSEKHLALKEEMEAVAASEGVTHGDAIGKAWARHNGHNRGDPYYLTYHKWQGSHDAAVGKASNWSGKGRPRETWVALLANSSPSPQIAHLTQRVEFLGIEIRGEAAAQTVEVAGSGMLIGGNEVRVSKGGRLEMAGGRITSRRWLTILPGGQFQGYGTIETTAYNSGRLKVTDSLRIDGDFVQHDPGTLRFQVKAPGIKEGRLKINGAVKLAGRLVVTLEKGVELSLGDRLHLIEADSLEGEFETLDLPTLTEGMQWDSSRLYQAGMLQITED